MPKPIDNGGVAFPGGTMADVGGAPYWDGMSLRDYFAAKAISILCDPKLEVDTREDIDFVPDPNGTWYRQGSYWYPYSMDGQKDPEFRARYGWSEPHRMVTTAEDRAARHCYRIADAMLAARIRPAAEGTG